MTADEDPVGDDLRRALERLVTMPDAVDIEIEERGRNVQLRVRVDPSDLGAVIGRRGRTVNALRTLIGLRGRDDGVRYDLKIIETDRD